MEQAKQRLLSSCSSEPQHNQLRLMCKTLELQQQHVWEQVLAAKLAEAAQEEAARACGLAKQLVRTCADGYSRQRDRMADMELVYRHGGLIDLRELQWEHPDPLPDLVQQRIKDCYDHVKRTLGFATIYAGATSCADVIAERRMLQDLYTDVPKPYEPGCPDVLTMSGQRRGRFEEHCHRFDKVAPALGAFGGDSHVSCDPQPQNPGTCRHAPQTLPHDARSGSTSSRRRSRRRWSGTPSRSAAAPLSTTRATRAPVRPTLAPPALLECY